MDQPHTQHKALKSKNLFMKAMFLFFFVCLFSATAAWGQSAFHAVQVNVNLIPPYSLYLDDYTTGTRDRIMVTLTNRDVQYPSMNVRLKLTIKANGFTLTTNSYAVTTPIVLHPNMPYRLSPEELAEYFDPKNLTASGMGTSAWQKDRKLPEGMIEFCFEAYEHFSNAKLSLPGSGVAWVSVQKPPQLSLPFDGETVSYRDPLNLLFQWTPRHTGISNVEYVFILKQLWDNGLKPEAAWAYSTELVRETVRPTSLLYGVAMYQLTPGMRYAWAVQAIAKDGIDDIRVFENNGLSEIRSFILADYCPPPTGITAKIDNGKISLEWVPLPEHIDFTVSYRQQGVEDAEWFYTKTTLPKVILYDVRPGYTYEYRIGSSCTPDNPIYGDVYSIAVPTQDTSERCGETGEIDVSNMALLPSLGPNEMFMGADFPIYVTQATGNNGIFSGEGYTIMPSVFAKAKLLVKWSNVTINADRKLVKGWVEAVYDESKSQIANLDDIFEGGTRFGTVQQGITKADVDLNFTISDGDIITFNPDDGTITVGDNVVDISHIIEEKNLTGEGAGSIFPITVKDETGSIYQLDETGEVDKDGNPVLSATLIGKESSPIAPGAVDFENIATDKAVVTFEKAGTYAFDTWITQYTGKQLIRDKYETLNDGYKVPFKLLSAGKTDIVKAKIQAVDGGINPSDVVFKTPMGTEFVYTYDEESNTYTITLTGGVAGDGQEVYALYPNGDGTYLNLGKLIVLSYPEQTYSLVAVNVNNAGVDVAALGSKLNEIYNPFGISWKVTEDTYTYTGNTQFIEQGSGLLSAYPNAMKEFNSSYSADRSIDSKTAYLFFFNQYGAGTTKNRNADGFMPRNKQFGYLFTQGFAGTDELYTAAAHELGHGMFVLKHTFDNDYKIPEGTTDNLMDYAASATHLAKWQWDLIHDQSVVVRVFEKDKDAMAFGDAGTDFICINDETALQKINKYQYFYLPDGSVINRGEHMVSGFFTQKDKTPGASGSVAAFKVGSTNYTHAYYTNSKKTVGYGLRSKTTGECVINANDLLTNETNAVRLQLQDNVILVMQSTAVLDRIPFSGDCNCNPIEIVEKHFKTSDIAQRYVDHALNQGVKLEHKIHEDEELKNKFKELVETQKNTNVKDEKFLTRELADKLKTYEIFNGKKFIVVHSFVNIISTDQNSWDEFAKVLFNETGLGSNDILITIPIVQCKGIGGDRGEYYFMPGVYSGSNVKVDYAKIGSSYLNTQKVVENWVAGTSDETIQFIADIFTHTTKKAIIYKGVYLANNTVEYSEYKTDAISGLAYNKTIKLYKQTGYEDLKNIINTGKERIKVFEQACVDASIQPLNPLYRIPPITKEKIIAGIRYDNQLNRLIKIEELSEQITDNYFIEYDPPFKYKLDFKEEHMESLNVKYIKGENGELGTNVQFYIFQLAFNQLREDINYDKINKSWFDKEHTLTNRLDWLLKRGIDDIIYGVLDGLSVALGFVALDIFPEGLGLIYSTIRGDQAQAGGYTVGITIAGSGGFLLKKATVKGLAKITKNGEVVLENASDKVIKEFIENNKRYIPNSDELIKLTGKDLREAVQKTFKNQADALMRGADDLLTNLKPLLSNEPKVVVDLFEQDFKGNLSMLQKMTNDNNLVVAWKYMASHPQLRVDAFTLESIGKFISNNQVFLQANKEGFEKILENLTRAGVRCRTCKDGANVGLKYFDEIIDDLDYVITRYGNKDGFDKLITEMAAAHQKADGGAFALAYLRSKGDNFADQVVSFEKFYLSGERFEADIELVTKLLELKSLNVSTWNNIGTGSYFEQFKAYFRSGKEFEYIANGAKLEGYGEEFVRKKFQNLFQNNVEELFGLNESFCKKFKLPNGRYVSNIDEFKALVQTDDFWKQLNFIKIE